MTPGPTQVAENVRLARSEATTNPDLDVAFYDFYKETCEKTASLIGANDNSHRVYILSGEGILGLEAACASLTEKEDKVLVISNGIFGKGFADFVKMYGGIATIYEDDNKKAIDIMKLKEFLDENSDFKYATLVHCDTPSGVLNDIKSICNLLAEYGILSVVDSVSSAFGEEIDVLQSHIDILCMGSQKAMSAPPGLTMICLSDKAMVAMENRKTPVASFYANLMIFKTYYEDKWFPYTMPISDIYGLRAAVENIEKNKDFVKNHSIISKAVRIAIIASGLSLYLESGYSNTVTVINVPKEISDKEILNHMIKNYNIMIAGCFDYLAGKVIRIGHMGENANIEDIGNTLEALDKTLKHFKINLKADLKKEFIKALNN